MKIRNLKTKVIGPILLLIPMACMHSVDGHHSGDRQCLDPQPSYQSLIYAIRWHPKYSTFLQKMEDSPYLLFNRSSILKSSFKILKLQEADT